MSDTVALVTGGTGAIGREICLALAQGGARVVANCHPADLEAGDEWVTAQAGKGVNIVLSAFDVSDFDAAGEAIRGIEQDVGPIDILVNAAGITRDAVLAKMEPHYWSAVLRVNLDSVYNSTKHVIEGMAERGFGRIVNISSVNGQRGQIGQTNYSAAKAGMHGFSMALAREVARKGVTVNTVSPGYVDSPLVMQIPEKVRDKVVKTIPVGRFAQPEEIARAVAFLTARESAYITGANLPVNGGFFMS